MTTTDVYLHGTSREEQQRLDLMNGLINEGCLRVLRPSEERAVLDVGCGLAQFTRLLARSLPNSRVVGIEADARQLEAAHELARQSGETELVELREGRAEALPLQETEAGSFDLVHTRFLLEHHRRPLDVVREMVRAARPGGRVVLFDDDHDVMRFSPAAPRIERLWQAFVRIYDRIGCDPYVGRHLPSLLARAGALPQRIDVAFYGACHGQPEFEPLVDNLLRVIGSARATMLDHDLASEAEFTAAYDEAQAWRHAPGAALWYSIRFAEGRRPL